MSTRQNQSSEIQLSKTLSYLLRHGAQKEGLEMDSYGYCKVEDVLAHRSVKRFKATEKDILRIVETNDKKRYSTKTENGVLYIKANQGHSIEVENLELEEVTDPSQFKVVVHGTFLDKWPLIKATGLKTMGRTHIHFAIGEYGSAQVISGMRKSAEVMIYLDMDKAMKDGIQFFISENKVILSKGLNGTIDPKYFLHVIDTKTGKPFDPHFPVTRP